MDRLTQFQNALAMRLVPAVTELHARPVLNQAGRPIVVAGNNALVARLKRADGADVALRIVASGDKGRDWPVRYSALADFQEVHRSPRLPAAVSVVRDGIPTFEEHATGSPPAVAMEWIEGPTLLQGVDRAARAGNASVLRALSAGFVQLWNDLQPAGFVHGDFTASNLIVRQSGQLGCVDLDEASWMDAPLGPAGEGSPGYRHPVLTRDASLRDAFAAVAIVTSLAALADNPALRSTYGDDASSPDGALLFSPWDLADPVSSPAFAASRVGASAHTNELLDALTSACLGTSGDIVEACRAIPRLDLDRFPASGLPASDVGWDVGPIVERMRAHYADTWDAPGQVDREDGPASPPPTPASVRPDGLWPGWSPPAPAGSAVANHVSPAVITELKGALARKDEAEVVRLWGQVNTDPIARLLAAEVESVIAAGYDRRVVEESRRKRDAAVVAVAEEAAGRQIPLGGQARSIARASRERIRVREKLDDALARGDKRGLAELAVSGELVVLGDADREALQRVIQAIEWPALQRAIQSDDDSLIVTAFDDELFADTTVLDAATRSRVALARERTSWVLDIREALRRRETGELRRLMFDPPEGGPERLSGPERRRVRLAIEREQALADLAEAVASGDDDAVVPALNKVERVGARIADRPTWMAIQRVVEREAIVDELRMAAEANPLDYARLAQLLPTARALGIEHDPRLGDEGLVERLEEAVIRIAHVRRIRAALSRDNDAAIMQASWPDPHGALDLLSEPERNRVASAIRARRRLARPRS